GLLRWGRTNQQVIQQPSPDSPVPIFRQHCHIDKCDDALAFIDEHPSDWLIMQQNNIVLAARIAILVLLLLEIELHTDERRELAFICNQHLEFIARAREEL